MEYFEKVFEGQHPRERYVTLATDLQNSLKASGLIEHAYVSGLNLGQAVISYYEDVYKIKGYEDIEKVNRPKIYAYTAFWLLRHSVIQIEEGIQDPSYLHINERIVAAWLVGHILHYLNVTVTTLDKCMLRFFDLLFYTFKYRIYTQKSLELMIVSFCAGLECGECVGR